MSKAILVVDMPTRCLECELVWDEMNNDIVRCSNGRRLDENEDYIYKQKPSWCPLKPMPSKKVPIFDPNSASYDEEYEKRIMYEIDGYNRCIDEIMGETE